jgi:uncharacterized protein (TIGR03083 family)
VEYVRLVDTTEYIGWLETEGDRFATTVDRGPLDAPVTTCPGWTLHDLANHLGQVHRWAASSARTGEQPQNTPGYDGEGEPIAAWYRAALTELVEVLRGVADDAPTWHPFPAPLEAAVWKRRQAQEVTIHRWDAQLAAGLTPDPIDPTLASDGVDEFFGMIVPRLSVREKVVTPSKSLHIHCTDVPGEWLVWTDDGGYQFRREHAKGDAAIRGPAASLLLFVFGRNEAPSDIDVVGDESAVAAWRTLPTF